MGIVLGLDISRKDVLTGVWNEKTGKAVAMSLPEISRGETVPASITQKGDGTWLIGAEAEKYAAANLRPGIVLVQELFGVSNEIAYEIGTGIYRSVDLQEIFIRELFKALTILRHGEEPEIIGVTGEKLDIGFQKVLYKIFEDIGMKAGNIFFITHADAFLWYETSNMDSGQKEMRDIMTADYTSYGLMCYILINGRRSRNVRYIEVKDRTEVIGGDFESIVEPEEIFTETVEKIMSHYDISRLYVTGYHVEEQWSKNMLQNFSRDRRVFCGRSLYVEGACCMAAIQQLPAGLIGEFGLVHEMSIKCFNNADGRKIVLASPAEDYRIFDKKLRFILEDTNEIEFEFADMRNKDVISCIFTLDGMVAREERTIQVEVDIKYTGRKSVVIKVKDLGFGDFYKTSHRVWEQIVNLV